jgi:hypothetical protein
LSLRQEFNANNLSPSELGLVGAQKCFKALVVYVERVKRLLDWTADMRGG